MLFFGEKMYYFQRNISDYRAATAHLSLLEHGAYCWLMDTYYLNESPLTLDERALFRQSMAKSDEEKQAVLDILNEFFTKTEDGWVNKRCEIEIQAYVSNAEKNRANGKKGGRPKKLIETENNPVGFFGYPKDNPAETQTKGNQEPINNNQEPINNNQEQKTKKPPLKKESTLAEYLEQCKQTGVEALQEGSEAHTVADGLGLSDDMLATAWFEFKRMMIESGKKYASWVKAFANYVRKNYLKIWYFHDNAVFWTNDGKGLCKLHLGYMPDNSNV